MPPARDLIASAAAALKDRIDEVNRLNVFPVPDGDTGTNMSLTMDAVMSAVSALPADASLGETCHAVTHGSLMGARGNSGVILSQILRGMCEGLDDAESPDSALLATALERSATVAYQAVRRPVEGTMLTVIKDCAAEATRASRDGVGADRALERVATAAFESVKNTPELLPVLKENGVVDAGGYGLALLVEGFVAAALGHKITVADVSSSAADLAHVRPVDDWSDSEYLYCTEFLLFGDQVDRNALGDYVAAVGGSELVVGDAGSYKVHVHTNDPGAVLTHVTAFGEVAEVHINNMRRQQAQRDASLRSESESPTPPKPLGIVAVAAGAGFRDILISLGADEVVSGGQTMNPSTQDLVDAVDRVNALKVIILPNNKNIVLAAGAAASVANKPVGVVPTRSIPQAFSALLANDGTDDLDRLVAEMTEAAVTVRTGEITTAVKAAKGKTGEISEGQVIGIVDDEEIEAVGDNVKDVSLQTARAMIGDETETLTLFAGEDLGDDDLALIARSFEAEFPQLVVETHRGDQPLYPLVMSVE